MNFKFESSIFNLAVISRVFLRLPKTFEISILNLAVIFAAIWPIQTGMPAILPPSLDCRQIQNTTNKQRHKA
jgi:hypothetical protein